MSEETVPPVEQQAEVEQAEQPPKLVAGYLVGLNEHGNFVFELVSKDQSLLELLGIQKYAENRIKQVLDNKMNTGDKLTLELGKVIATLVQEIGKLTAQLKKPDNKLA
jgi:hypothetical protein